MIRLGLSIFSVILFSPDIFGQDRGPSINSSTKPNLTWYAVRAGLGGGNGAEFPSLHLGGEFEYQTKNKMAGIRISYLNQLVEFADGPTNKPSIEMSLKAGIRLLRNNSSFLFHSGFGLISGTDYQATGLYEYSEKKVLQASIPLGLEWRRIYNGWAWGLGGFGSLSKSFSHVGIGLSLGLIRRRI